MCGNTLNRTRAGGAIEIPKGPEKREKATLVYIVLAAYRVCTELCPFIAIPLLAKAYSKDLALGGLKLKFSVVNFKKPQIFKVQIQNIILNSEQNILKSH